MASFIGSLKTVGKPVWLQFVFASADYRAGFCLENCEAENERTGDEVVYGWMIWRAENERGIEAEFHSVMRRGPHLRDITPRVDGEAKILFVPDLERKAVRIGPRVWQSWKNQIAIGDVLKPTCKFVLQIIDPP